LKLDELAALVASAAVVLPAGAVPLVGVFHSSSADYVETLLVGWLNEPSRVLVAWARPAQVCPGLGPYQSPSAL
jgi:hypothetical protein